MLNIYGDGEQTRDFIFVKDAVKYFWAAMQSANKDGSTYNICTGHATTINKLATTMSQLMQKQSNTNYEAARIGDIRNSCGNPWLAQDRLGVRADTALEDGLKVLLEIS